jgi:hypothetical protein
VEDAMTDNGIEPTGFKTGIEQVGDAEIVFFVETILAGGSGVVTGQIDHTDGNIGACDFETAFFKDGNKPAGTAGAIEN